MPAGKMYLAAPAKTTVAFKKGFTPKLSKLYSVSSKKQKQRKNEKTSKFISKVLSDGVKYISADYYNNTIMSFGNNIFINDLVVRDIPKYDPTSATSDRAKNLEMSRTSDNLYFKGLTFKITLCNYGDRNAGIRVILFKNDAWQEQLNTVGCPNLFADVNGNDWAPSKLTNVLLNQPFNKNLIRKRQNIIFDKEYILGARTVEFPCWNGGGVQTTTPIQPHKEQIQSHRRKYYKVNQRVEYETDVLNEDLKNGRYYLIILWSNDSGEDKGTTVVNYMMQCTLAQS